MGLWSRKSVAVLQREAAEEGEHGLRRTLTASNLTLLGIGAIIGAGIFVLTGNAAAIYAGPGVVLSMVAAGLACGFAGLAGGLFAFSKGSISPETLGLGRSIDVLVMLLLGGLNAPFGPLLGAGAFVWLQDALARVTEYWRACVGALIVLLVIAFPNGIGGAYARVRGALRP